MAASSELPVHQDMLSDPSFGNDSVEEVRRASSGSFTSLTPLAFLGRSADVFADKAAIAYGDRRLSYQRVRCAGHPTGARVTGFRHTAR